MRRAVVLALMLLGLAGSCWAVPVTSPFGWRIHPVTGQYRFHSGVDLGYNFGEDVRAMLPGKVVYCYWWGGYGNCVILAHPNGDHTLYGHMSRIDVSYGQDVVRGQSLGKIGSTGMSTGPHLHLELWHNGSYVDPVAFFYGNRIQNTEFLQGREFPVSVGGNQAPKPADVPISPDGLEVPEEQREQALKQLNEKSMGEEKKQADSVFF